MNVRVKAVIAGIVLAGGWSANVCVAHPSAVGVSVTQESGWAGFYSAVGMPAVAVPSGGWSSITDLLSPYRVYPSVLDVDWLQDGRLHDPASATGAGLGLGYVWHRMRLEGTLVQIHEGREPPFGTGMPKPFTTTTGRLSYQTFSNWTFQVAHGHLSRQSLTDADDDVRRTSVAAIHDRPFRGSNWQTIIAFGRNGSKADGDVGNAWMFESSLRLARVHTVFTRAERASANELFADRDALYGQNFHANRMTLGYVYAIPLGVRSQMNFGGTVSRRSMPQEAVRALGNDPPSYKIFVRLSLQLP